VLAIFLNYVLDLRQVRISRARVDGSAVATLLAISIGGILFFYALSVDGMVLNFRWKELWADFDLGRRILSVGNPAAIEQLIIQFGFVAYVAFVARYGEKGSCRIFHRRANPGAVVFCPASDFSAASATLVGQGLGAGDPKFSRKAGWESTGMAVVLMSAMGLLFIVSRMRLYGNGIEYTVQFMSRWPPAHP